MLSSKMLNDIENLAKEELERANKDYPQFVSAHEAWAVTKEEIEEAEVELQCLNSSLSKIWLDVRADVKDVAEVSCLKNRAIFLAAESIQVAAMAQKYIDMLNREDKE